MNNERDRPAETKKKEIEVTPDMIEAAFEVYEESGLVDTPLPIDKSVIKEMISAAISVRKVSF